MARRLFVWLSCLVWVLVLALPAPLSSGEAASSALDEELRANDELIAALERRRDLLELRRKQQGAAAASFPTAAPQSAIVLPNGDMAVPPESVAAPQAPAAAAATGKQALARESADAEAAAPPPLAAASVLPPPVPVLDVVEETFVVSAAEEQLEMDVDLGAFTTYLPIRSRKVHPPRGNDDNGTGDDESNRFAHRLPPPAESSPPIALLPLSWRLPMRAVQLQRRGAVSSPLVDSLLLRIHEDGYVHASPLLPNVAVDPMQLPLGAASAATDAASSASWPVLFDYSSSPAGASLPPSTAAGKRETKRVLLTAAASLIFQNRPKVFVARSDGSIDAFDVTAFEEGQRVTDVAPTSSSSGSRAWSFSGVLADVDPKRSHAPVSTPPEQQQVPLDANAGAVVQENECAGVAAGESCQQQKRPPRRCLERRGRWDASTEAAPSCWLSGPNGEENATSTVILSFTCSIALPLWSSVEQGDADGSQGPELATSIVAQANSHVSISLFVGTSRERLLEFDQKCRLVRILQLRDARAQNAADTAVGSSPTPGGSIASLTSAGHLLAFVPDGVRRTADEIASSQGAIVVLRASRSTRAGSVPSSASAAALTETFDSVRCPGRRWGDVVSSLSFDPVPTQRDARLVYLWASLTNGDSLLYTVPRNLNAAAASRRRSAAAATAAAPGDVAPEEESLGMEGVECVLRQRIETNLPQGAQTKRQRGDLPSTTCIVALPGGFAFGASASGVAIFNASALDAPETLLAPLAALDAPPLAGGLVENGHLWGCMARDASGACFGADSAAVTLQPLRRVLCAAWPTSDAEQQVLLRAARRRKSSAPRASSPAKGNSHSYYQQRPGQPSLPLAPLHCVAAHSDLGETVLFYSYLPAPEGLFAAGSAGGKWSQDLFSVLRIPIILGGLCLAVFFHFCGKRQRGVRGVGGSNDDDDVGGRVGPFRRLLGAFAGCGPLGRVTAMQSFWGGRAAAAGGEDDDIFHEHMRSYSRGFSPPDEVAAGRGRGGGLPPSMQRRQPPPPSPHGYEEGIAHDDLFSGGSSSRRGFLDEGDDDDVGSGLDVWTKKRAENVGGGRSGASRRRRAPPTLLPRHELPPPGAAAPEQLRPHAQHLQQSRGGGRGDFSPSLVGASSPHSPHDEDGGDGSAADSLDDVRLRRLTQKFSALASQASASSEGASHRPPRFNTAAPRGDMVAGGSSGAEGRHAADDEEASGPRRWADALSGVERRTGEVSQNIDLLPDEDDEGDMAAAEQDEELAEGGKVSGSHDVGIEHDAEDSESLCDAIEQRIKDACTRSLSPMLPDGVGELEDEGKHANASAAPAAAAAATSAAPPVSRGGGDDGEGLTSSSLNKMLRRMAAEADEGVVDTD